MAVFARKITRGKWGPTVGLSDEEISADAVTGDLRTTNRTLSFWRCGEEDESSLGDVVLALASGADRVDVVDLAWLAESDVTEKRLDVVESQGSTPVEELRKRHVDIGRLDLERLGTVARLIRGALDNSRFKRFTKAEVVNLLVKAVSEDRLKLDALKRDVAEEVQKKMPPPTTDATRDPARE